MTRKEAEEIIERIYSSSTKNWIGRQLDAYTELGILKLDPEKETFTIKPGKDYCIAFQGDYPEDPLRYVHGTVHHVVE